MKNTILAILIFALASCTNSTSTSEDPIAQEDSTTEVKSEKAETPVKGYTIGDEATDFSLPSTNGKAVSLADYPDAKGFIVTFTCNHCPYAVAYEQRIMDLDATYASLGYPVIAISPNDTTVVPEDGLSSMRTRAEEKGYTFPYLLDETQDIYPQYGATKTPHIFILNKEEGKNIVKYIGAIDNNYEDATDVTERYVEDAVNALLAGNEVGITETKAIGCSIKDKRKTK
ncbi:MAG: redoxin domain-containing protein [Bacteroidetes bacterium]|jgi:peroxiredoxin|nr:redoxin domain-containing protein [Bacteroidota bacterium]